MKGVCRLLKSADRGYLFFLLFFIQFYANLQRALGKAIGRGRALRSFKVIQGHRDWYQSKAPMRFAISLSM